MESETAAWSPTCQADGHYLGEQAQHRYHRGQPDPDSTGRTRQPVEPQISETRDERLARTIRGEIYAGEYLPGDALPATAVIAARHGISTAMAQRAFDILRREGLVRSEQGRGTYVCDRHPFTAVVAARPSGRLPGSRLVADAERSEPAVTGLTVSDDSDRRIWRMTIDAADSAPAAVIAVAVARAAGAGGQVAVAVEPVQQGG
jgi:GntR family transcriptional regulator